MTKTAFLAALRRHLIDTYQWAADAAKLDRFMASVEATIRGDVQTWNPDGEASTAAWRESGGTGKVALRRLRELAE